MPGTSDLIAELSPEKLAVLHLRFAERRRNVSETLTTSPTDHVTDTSTNHQQSIEHPLVEKATVALGEVLSNAEMSNAASATHSELATHNHAELPIDQPSAIDRITRYTTEEELVAEVGHLSDEEVAVALDKLLSNAEMGNAASATHSELATHNHAELPVDRPSVVDRITRYTTEEELVAEVGRLSDEEVAVALDKLLSNAEMGNAAELPVDRPTAINGVRGNAIPVEAQQDDQPLWEVENTQSHLAEAYQNYMQGVQPARIPEDVRRRLEEAHQNYVQAIKQAFIEMDVATVDVNTLSAISQSMSMAAWVAVAWGLGTRTP